MSKTRTIKIRLDTYRLLKIICADHGKTMVGMLEELVYEKLKDKSHLTMDVLAGRKNREKKRGTLHVEKKP